ncbi:MAG TPA: PAS domain S-box protein [Methanoregula sp.]|nr:PAS domain S-box protein [Methanoregula sp.]
MIINSSIAILLLLIAGTISLLLAYIGWQNRAQTIVQPFILLMAAETVWIFGYVVELSSSSLDAVILINNIEYPALQTVPIAWLFIVLCFTGREQYLTRRTVPLFFIIPAIVWVLVLTNPLHHLYYTGFYESSFGGSTIWLYEHGPLFWIHIGYCYLVTLIALILAAGRLFVSTELYRRQSILLVCAACIPAFCNMAYVFQIAPFPQYDMTPFAFLASGIILAVGLLRYQLFSAVPVAYSLVFYTMRDGVIVTNNDYRVIDLNPAAERITGVSSHDAIGKMVEEVFPLLASLREDPALSGERRIEAEVQKEGFLRFYDVAVTPMDRAGAGPSGYLCLFRDISERKGSELALAQANRKIGLLASITRHDLMNKLMAVGSYLELSRELATDPTQMEYLDRQLGAVNAMGQQIAFTREYEQLGAKAPVWQQVSSVINRIRNQVDFHGVLLESSTGLLEVYADPMLEKVFYNLFDNAVTYGGDGLSEITVSCHRSEGDIVIVVEDNGAGITPEDKERLFERGFGKNTGLGLFLSREILAITGIRIEEIGEPGHGARFGIRVPAGKFRNVGLRP